MSLLTHDVESETDKSVVGRERQQNFIHEQNVLEIIDDALSVQEIHGRCEEVPVQGLGEAQVLLLTRHIGDSNDFLEREDLNCSHNANDVNVSGEHSDEKASNHYEGPYRSGNEGLFLLLVIGLSGFLRNRRKRDLVSYSPQVHQDSITYLLLGDCGLLGDAAVAWVGRLRGGIADVGGHARAPLTFLVRKPDIATRHDGR